VRKAAALFNGKLLETISGNKLAVGSYVLEQKAIILALDNLVPSLMPLKEGIANGGPYMKIPFEQGATNLAMTTVVRNGPNVTVNLVRSKGTDC